MSRGPKGEGSARGWVGILLALVAVVALGTLAGRRFYGERSARVHRIAGATMGTTWTLQISLPEGAPAAWIDAIGDTVQARLDRVERLMSTWDSTTELSRFNRSKDTSAIALSPETIEVLEIARAAGAASEGALDVTVGPLVAAWGFGPEAAGGGSPGEEELRALRLRTGADKLHVDRRRGTARKAHPGLAVDLSAVAKGYALDLAGEGVRRMGGSAFALEVGGEVLARGSRAGGSGWRVGIEAPIAGERAIYRVLELRDEAVATSGDYRNFVDLDGARYGHLVDPRTGRPVPWRGFSVSVVHPEAAWADAWATALSVMGPERGLERARALGLEAVFVIPSTDGGFEASYTEGLADRLDP